MDDMGAETGPLGSGGGGGDMLAATYDPTGIEASAFDTDNHIDGSTNGVYTLTERTKLSGIEAGAEVNNISDANATDLTDGGETTLHKHASSSINAATTDRVLGRDSAGAGAVEELTLSQVLDFIGSAAQGDILYRGASNWERLAAGTSGQALLTGGASANPSWGAGGDWVMITDSTAGEDGVASFDFTSIPSTYKHLKLILTGRSEKASAYIETVTLKINNEAGTTTGKQYYGIMVGFYGNGSGGGAFETFQQYTAGVAPMCAVIPAASSTANVFATYEFTFADYAATNKAKNVLVFGNYQGRDLSNFQEVFNGFVIYENTEAINRITIYPAANDFAQYSRATLYGMK